MAKRWSEVAASDEFKALAPEEQDGARRQYFEDVVAPQVPGEHRDSAWEQFDADTGGRRTIPVGVSPSKAQGGRGFINPPAAVQKVTGPSRAQRIAEMDDATNPDSVNYLPVTDNAVSALQTDARGGMDAKRTKSAGRVLDADIEKPSVTGTLRDVAAGALQIPGVMVKGAADIARLATGDTFGKDTGQAAEKINKSIRENVGSRRAQQQEQRFQQDMADPNLNPADVVVGNPGALADEILPTVGSMALPVGVSALAGKLATGGRAAQLAAAIDPATVAARANAVREAAAIGATVVQNAGDTYSTVRDAGGDQDAAYLAAAITAPATYVAGRLTGGGAEASAAKLFAGSAKGAAKEIPRAMLREGVQEMGEEAGQYTGETVGTGAAFDGNQAGKRLAVAGTLGAVMGGAVEGAGAARELRIKALRDAGETDAANQMQRKHDIDSEIQRLPGNDDFAQVYREMRTTGVKPAEAAARSAVAVTFKGTAVGIPEKALSAAMAKTKDMPLDDVPGFLQRFTTSLAKRGLVQPFEGIDQLGAKLEAARDDAIDTTLGAIYQPVKPAMSAIQELETKQAQAPENIAQEATSFVAELPASAELDMAAHDAATSPLNNLPEPTQAQKSAGNYKVGRVNLHGLNISIENPEGSVRRGVGDDGKPWENELRAHYGYIRGTEGNDGDHVDAFIGPNPDSQKVFVVDQVNKDGSFDEHKVMLGVDNLQQADDLYHANYHAGWTGRGAITEMPIDQFKKWVKDGIKTKPVGQITTPDAGAATADATDAVQPTAGGDAAAPANPVYLGRDNVAIGEGGKAFKTRKAADDARKLNPMMRVVRADGGYALTEKPPAQLAAQEAAAKRLRQPRTSPRGEPIPAHAMIAAEGGLQPGNRADMGMQGNVTVGNRKLFAGEGRGLSIERATEKLVEQGYLPEGASHDQARDLIKRSLTNPQYTPEGTEQMAAAELEARRVAAIAEIEEASDNQFFEIDDADIPWGAEVSNTSTEAAMRALGFTDQEISDAIANESRVQGQDSQDSGGPDEGTATPAQTDLGRRESPQGADPGGRGEARREEPRVEPAQTPAPAGVSVSADEEAWHIALKAKAHAVEKPGDVMLGNEKFVSFDNAMTAARDAIRAGVLRNVPFQYANILDIAPRDWDRMVAAIATEQAAKNDGAAFETQKRPDGTLAVKGDPAAILEALNEIPRRSLTPMRGGILVGRTQADKAMAILQPADLTAPTRSEVVEQKDRADQATKDKEEADRKADKQAREEEDRKRIAKASEAAADSFELGGDAMANLTGQKDIFAEEPVAKMDPVKIEDAGEKIGGARKDKWKDRGLDLADLDGMSESEGAELATKANVWKPDYEAMAEASEPVTAAMVKTVYDQLAAQPKKNTPAGRRNYVTMMQAVRKAYSEAKSPEDVKQAGDKLKRAIGLYTDNPDQKKQAREVLFSVYKGRSDPFVLGYNELSKAKKMVEDGFPAKGEPWKKRLTLRAYTAGGFTPRGIELTVEESAALGTPLTTDQIVSGFYRINAKDGKAVGYAPTKADAEAMAKTVYERDLKKGAGEKAEPSRPNLDALKRENLPKRTDRDVSADDFVKDFGFRGVEFGNWAAQDERQRIVNMAYDGLMDLAEIMGVPPKAMSLNGTMGMAFGARGGGKFAAHYEPGKLVINMTKINGGGSMAHEWAHALDHYFGELNQKDAYTTKARGASGWYDEQQYKGVPTTRMEKDADGKWANVTKLRLNNLRPEMAKAFDGVMSALFSGQETKAQMVRSEELAIERYEALAARETDPEMKAVYQRGIESRKQSLEELRKDPEDKTYPKGRSAYAGEAQKLVGKSATGYWTRPTEMFARAFESWVFDKVTAMGAKSDYLVHGVEEDRFAGGNYKGNPYPTGQERATINAAFDKLASTIQTKETDKGVAMFARGALDEAFRRTIAPRSFMPITEVQKAIDQLTAKWKDGPTVKVVRTPADLPIDSPTDVRGLIHKGVAYIVAANHRDRRAVALTLGHEAIGHYGLWKMLGADGTRQFQRQLQQAIKSGNAPLNKIAQQVRELYKNGDGKFNLSPEQEANEIAAFAVEEAIDADGNFKPGFGFFKAVWAKVADFLRGIGIDIKFTNSELQGMLVSAMRGLETGSRLDGGAKGLVAAARDGEAETDVSDPKTGISKALLELGQNDDLYQYPRSNNLELQHIAEDKATPERGAIKVSDVDKASDNNKLWMLANTTPDDNPAKGVKSWILTMPSGKLATLTKKGNEVYINVSGVGEGMGGSAVYDLAANYALNNGLVFIGDPNGVSAAAMRRRLENMLSSAIKYGTTDHLKPHPDQYLGNEAIGVPPLDWTNGDTLSNIRHMVDVSIASTEHLNPKASKDVRFDAATQSFRDGRDVRVGHEQLSSVLAEDGRTSGAGQGGRATLQRSALFKSLLQSEGARRAFLEQLRRQQDSGSETPSGELKGSFYARGGQGNGTGVTPGLFAPTVWSTPDPTRTDRIIYELQDGRVDLKRVQEAITKSGQQIEEKWDARLAETLYPGRVAYRSQRFLETEAHPLLKAMAVHKVPMDELADYLHARGAEERNAQVAKVNPNLPDGGAGKNSKGVLLTNQAARDYLANINPARKQVLDVLAAKVDAITAGTRTLLVAEGLEKQETIDAWTSTYKNYVPMFRDEAQSGAPHPQGSGFSVKGSASKRATGSTKEVTNILAHVLMQREAAITRAEKNRVAVALYGQALSHPNPEFWTTIKPNMTHAQIGAELQAMGVDPATAAVGMERAPTITTVDPVSGKKVDRPNPLYKSLPGAIPLKVNAEDRVLMINTETERGARMAENLKNLDGLTKLDLAGSIIGKATRWLASVNTQYNPAFGLVNVTRDTLGGAINLGSTELRGKSLKVLGNTVSAMQGIARELASGKGGKWGDLYRQFQADGGQTGFKELFRDANERAKAVEKELKAAHSAGKLTPGNAAHAVLDMLDGFNTTMENAVRLSAYSAALDEGMSRAHAARLARELTVDFNRKGRMGRELGPLYAFFNASVQGTARTMQAIKGPTGAKIIAGGLALGVTQALMLMAAGYDDDEIPEFVKSRALVIPLNWSGKGEKSHVLIPYPLGLHVIPNTSRIITELALNGAKDAGKRSVAAIGEIAGAINPMGGGNVLTADGALKTVAPTVVDPLIELGFNRNFAGNTIERPPLKGETDTRPGVARAKESTMRSTTGQVYMGISKALNTMTGGTDYEAGKVSPTPEMLRYLAQTVGGGVLREIEKTINASTAASFGKDVKPNAIPVVGRFYGEVDAGQVKTSRYFDNSTKIDKLETTAKTMTKAGDTQALEKLYAENPEIALVKLGNRVQSAVAKLNKAAVQSVNDPEGGRALDQDRIALMDVLNQAVANLEKETKPPTPAAKIKSWRREAVTP